MTNNFPSDISGIHPNALRFIRSIGARETGFKKSEAASEFYNQSSRNANVRRYGQSGADYGFYQTNRRDVQDAVRRGVPQGIADALDNGGGKGNYTVEQQTVAMNAYLQKLNPKGYDAMLRGDWDSANKAFNGKWPSLPGGKSYRSANDAKANAALAGQILPGMVSSSNDKPGQAPSGQPGQQPGQAPSGQPEQQPEQQQTGVERIPESRRKAIETLSASEQYKHHSPEKINEIVEDVVKNVPGANIDTVLDKLSSMGAERLEYSAMSSLLPGAPSIEVAIQQTQKELTQQTSTAISGQQSSEFTQPLRTYQFKPYKQDESFGTLQSAPKINTLQGQNLSEKFPEGTQRFFREGGGTKGLNPKLVEVLKEASKDLPPGYHVRMHSGVDKRDTGTKNHPGGVAIDLRIVDSNGKVLRDRGFGEGHEIYERLAQSMDIRGQQMFPGTKYIWGGAWRAAGGDRMHYQIVDPNQIVPGASPSSGQYSWEKGVSSNLWAGQNAAQQFMSPDELKQYRDQITEKYKQEQLLNQGIIPQTTVSATAPEAAPATATASTTAPAIFDAAIATPPAAPPMTSDPNINNTNAVTTANVPQVSATPAAAPPMTSDPFRGAFSDPNINNTNAVTTANVPQVSATPAVDPQDGPGTTPPPPPPAVSPSMPPIMAAATPVAPPPPKSPNFSLYGASVPSNPSVVTTSPDDIAIRAASTRLSGRTTEGGVGGGGGAGEGGGSAGGETPSQNNTDYSPPSPGSTGQSQSDESLCWV